MKKFNTTGTCIPEKHYMVDISPKILKISKLIEDEAYFTINRARQYGKTTTLAALYRSLKDTYYIIRLSFEGASEESFKDNVSFVNYFMREIRDFLNKTSPDISFPSGYNLDPDCKELNESPFKWIGDFITDLCHTNSKEILLMVDEVDKICDNQIFLNFLGMLRSKFLARSEGLDTTFKSVILAGIYDIKNLKLRPDQERKYNSPWNIATDFDIDMSFSPEDIRTMLFEYQNDKGCEFDIQEVSDRIYFYTNGYPFLVSWICKIIDETDGYTWDIPGVDLAQKDLLATRNTLFDDIKKNVTSHPDLREMIMTVLAEGKSYPYSITDSSIELGTMLGLVSKKGGMACISNKIFESYLYDYATGEKLREEKHFHPSDHAYVSNGCLDMPLILNKFQDLMRAEYRESDQRFVEANGRLLFLCFIKPIINGIGFYYVESETRNSTRMDLVITYGNREYIIELKIWHGEEYRKEGIKQLERYMDSRSANDGFLISFSFNRNKDYRRGYISREEIDKHIYEIIV